LNEIPKEVPVNTIPMRLPERQAHFHHGLPILLPLVLLILGPVAALAETNKPASIAGTQASAQASTDGGGTRVIWRRIVGIVVPDNIVGSPPESGDCDKNCAVGAPIPWTATGGRAEVDLRNGKLTFTVNGLVLAEAFGCCTMGTPTIVTKVKGTLVCNDTAPGLAELVDTESVRIRNSGFATFSGRLDLPPSCTDEPDDIAFVIRIADLSIDDDFQELIGMWNAFGADRVIRRPDR
jgi:hypothetical protein